MMMIVKAVEPPPIIPRRMRRQAARLQSRPAKTATVATPTTVENNSQLEERKTSLPRLVMVILLIALSAPAVGAVVYHSLNNYLSQRHTPPPITATDLDFPLEPFPNNKNLPPLEMVSDIPINPPVITLDNVLAPDPIIDIPLINPPVLDIAIQHIEVKEKNKQPEIVEITPTDIIQPFDDLTWDDDLLTAIQKIQAMKTLETIQLTWEKRTCNIKQPGIQIEQSDIQGKLQTFLHPIPARHTNLFDRSSYSNSPGYYSPRPIQGLNKHVMKSAPTITAKPIIISNGAFVLSVGFVSEPGSILTAPDKALAQAKQAFGSKVDFYCPLRLSFVQLSLYEDTTTTKLDIETSRTIAKTILSRLTQKYPTLPCKSHSTYNGKTTEWSDASKHQLELQGERSGRRYRSSITLKYSNCPTDFSRKLLVHQKKLRELAHQKKFTGKEDQQAKL